MSDFDAVTKAIESKLASFTPAIPIAWENTKYTPVKGVAYMKADVMPAEPDNSEQGVNNYFERGIFQMTLFYPINKGTKDVRLKAVALREFFHRGLTMTNSGVSVLVTTTPSIVKGFNDLDRYVVPVWFKYQAHISR